ncbi:MAG: RluA family pseudouridine synthase [Sandaracinaceae bacterium]
MRLDVEVGAADAGGRLDAFLVRGVEELSRARARAAIAEGRVLVNGRVTTRGGTTLRAGDRVVLTEAPPSPSFLPAPPDGSVVLVVAHLDARFVVVDKPAGVPTHPLRPDEAATLANALLGRFPEMAGVGYASREPGIVHRLDNETSGLVLAARDAETFERLRAALTAGEIDKRYEILVEGALDPGLRSIDAPIANHPRDRRRVVAYLEAAPEGARAARTEVLATEAVGPFTRVEVRASTATRHQIRAHFAAIGRPLVGDARYGGRHREGLGRHYLHAMALALRHPFTGDALTITAPRPPELERFLREAVR